LLSEQWNVYAALFHFMTKWRDFHLQLPYQNLGNESQEPVSATPEFYESFIEMYGKPPHHFHSVGRRSEDVLLPVPVKPGSELYELLLARGTTRQFDPDTDMGLEQLSTLLYYVFGCHGYSPVYDDIYGLKKTSPSGGGLHPVEVYPLVLRVESLDAGLYHYNVERNCLESIHKLSRETASDLANEFTAGQGYPSRAGVLFIMTARFYRNYWKYRRHNKAYSVILMDAAHLSQSLYLVCTEIGLGAFVTAAINNENIEKWLGIDGFREGAILICGCGIPTDDVSHLDPTFLPYIPPDKIKI
jgi:putative peptide maturation dehydrogenase